MAKTPREKRQTDNDTAAVTSRRRGRRGNQPLTALALLIAGATGGGAWLYLNQQSRGQDLDLVGPPEPSLTVTALLTARDLGSFLQENVTKDVSNMASLLYRAAAEDAEEVTIEDAVPTVEEPGNTVAEVVPRRVTRASAKSPTLRLGIDLPQAAALPKEPPLFMVFDHGHSSVIPPGTGTIRLRAKHLPHKPLLKALAELQLKAKSASGVEKVGLVEVVISETGEVEQVKLLAAPQDVHESMLLSAIKAWHFEPAVKDGQAVRYRQIIPISVARL